jgi:hypothetical protein
MELELSREYYPEGTNGNIQHEGQLVCPSIELPWRENQRSVSCIPEGRYEVRKRYTQKRGHHLLIVDVRGRSGILIHPANDAQKELLGCIAPVTKLTGPGRGIQSRAANEKLKELVTAALDRKEKVFITIKSKEE